MPMFREAVVLFAAATPILPAYAQSSAKVDRGKANIMLCDSLEHAIAFTIAINEGAPDDVAKDIVGKAAGAEVCDKFIGHASVEEQKRLVNKGLAYIVTSYTFKGVGAMRWSAIPSDRE